MLAFDIVDVFGAGPFSGNQLAVVHGAGDLTTEQCQAIAVEFGFSETTFPVPRGPAGRAAYDVRIFTPGAEIPFAGHPTLGTAWALVQRGLLAGPDVVQHCGAGEVAVRLGAGGHDPVRLTAQPRDLLGPLPAQLVADLAAGVGLTADDVAGPVFAAGTGLTWVHLPVVAGATARAFPAGTPLDASRFAEVGTLCDPLDGVAVLELSPADAGDEAAPGSDAVQVRSRVFVPGLGVDEDAATGSAASGLGMALVAGGVLPRGGRYVITQGVEMGRPSRLSCAVVVDEDSGRVRHCEVSGQVHLAARGEVAVP